MGLFYNKIYPAQPQVGTKNAAGTMTGVALTSSYQTYGAGKPTGLITVGSQPKINYNIAYITGASETATTICFKVENTSDTVNFFRLPNESVSAGVGTLTANEYQFAGGAGATTYLFSIGIDIFYKELRISFKESGVNSNAGNVYCEADLSGK